MPRDPAAGPPVEGLPPYDHKAVGKKWLAYIAKRAAGMREDEEARLARERELNGAIDFQSERFRRGLAKWREEDSRRHGAVEDVHD